METTTENLDDAISGSEVRQIVSEIRWAGYSVLGAEEHIEVVNETGRLITDIQKTRNGFRDTSLFSRISKALKTKTDADLRNDSMDLYKSKALMYTDTSPQGDIRLNIYSQTGSNPDKRGLTVAFSLDFGSSEDACNNFIMSVENNPMFLKSAMERTFSPDFDPKNTVLRRDMDYVRTDSNSTYCNLSPFIRLEPTTPVRLLKIT